MTTTKPGMEDQALRQLALDITDGKVYGSWQVKDSNILTMVFMPLTFMDDGGHKRIRQFAHIYEYMDQAGPRAINGQPMFTSFRGISNDDWDKLVPMVTELIGQRKAFLEATAASVEDRR